MHDTTLRRRAGAAALCVLVGLAAPAVRAADTPSAPALRAEFTQNPRCPVFPSGEAPTLRVTVPGPRAEADTLEWEVRDYLDAVRGRGGLAVPAGTENWTGELAMTDMGPGYFEVRPRLAKAGWTIPQTGTRPAGRVVYGVLPAITALPLEYVDQSRFGAQGTNHVQPDRNPYLPVYPLLGVKWAYLSRKLGEIAPDGPDSFKPVLDLETAKRSRHFETAAGISPLVDFHGLPNWLMDIPEGFSFRSKALTENGQRFRPNDYAVYKELIARAVRENLVRRQAAPLGQRHAYYQIHWEPDWHWKGADEDFIRMYRCAYEAIHENDPDGRLLGPNYGVLRTGNRLLKRLFEQGLGRYLDGLVFHTYYLAADGVEGRQTLVDDMRELVALARHHLKPGALLMNTEWGTNWRVPPDRDPEALRDEIATFMRGHLIVLGEGADCTWYFYTADHNPRGSGLLFNLAFPGVRFGSGDIAPKPVFMAAATATRLLEGTKTLGPVEYLGPQILGYAFDRAGEAVLALWSKDDREQTVRLPTGGAERVAFVDSVGVETPLAAERGVAEARIGRMPVWVRGLPVAAFPFGAAGRAEGFAGDAVALPVSVAQGEPALFRDGAWQPAGRDGRLLLPADAPEGDLLAGVFAPGGDRMTGAVLVRVKPSLSLSTLRQLAPGKMAFRLANVQPRPVRGVAVLRIGGAETASRTVEVAGGGETTLEFDSRAFPPGARARLEFTDAGGARCGLDSATVRKVLQAHPAATPPAIDGRLDEWPLELFTAYADEERPGPSAGMNVRLAAQYDKDHLYLAVKTNDRQHLQLKHPSGLWMHDSVQIGLAVHPRGAEWATWQKMGLAKNSLHEAYACYRDMGDAFPYGEVPGSAIPWRFSHAGGESHYEIKIPWAQVEPDLNGPPAEGYLGLGVLVNNTDYTDVDNKKEGPRRLADLLGGMGWSKPEEFGLLELK